MARKNASTLDPALAEKIVSQVKEDEIVSMSCDVINIPSPTGGELQMAQYIEGRWRQLGLNVTWQEVEDSRANVIGRLRGGLHRLSANFVMEFADLVRADPGVGEPGLGQLRLERLTLVAQLPIQLVLLGIEDAVVNGLLELVKIFEAALFCRDLGSLNHVGIIARFACGGAVPLRRYPLGGGADRLLAGADRARLRGVALRVLEIGNGRRRVLRWRGAEPQVLDLLGHGVSGVHKTGALQLQLRGFLGREFLALVPE